MEHQSEIKIVSVVSLSDINQMALSRGTCVSQSDRKLAGQPLYVVDHEVGLWTFDELKKHFLN